MLILAAVSIATLTGENGILTQATRAKEQTEIADIIERAKIDILGVQVEKKSGDIMEAEVDSILEPKYGTLSGEGEDKVLTTDKGYVIKVSDIWSGTTSGNGTDKTTLAKDVLKTDSTATDEADKSPYVTYNGLTCRVLYNDETHGLQIITVASVGTVTLGSGDTMVTSSDFTYGGSLTLSDDFKKAATSYNNVVDNLNNKAKSYMDTKGIATDSRCLGSLPTLKDGKFQGDTTTEMWSGTYGYLTTYSWNNKFKTTDTNSGEDVEQLNSLGLHVISGDSWVASRFVGSNYSDTDFYVRGLTSSGGAATTGLCRVSANGTARCYSPSLGFRPIFLLSSDVIISSGDGSSGNPYVIE